MVSRPRTFLKCSRPLFHVRLEQDGNGISRSELVSTERRANHPHATEYLRWYVAEDALYGMDVCAADRIPRRRTKATIEPLDQNIDHYRNMIQSNLALGVQACYRGPRLFDTDRVKEMVKSQVDWYKAHREILESDLIHGRRADAKGLDWMLHAKSEIKRERLRSDLQPDRDRKIRNTSYSSLLHRNSRKDRGG